MTGDQQADVIHRLEADEALSPECARIRRLLESAGTPIPMNDLWIAAIASQHSLPIISRDAHFDLVPGITRVTW
jgi:tRNA(fMet)-specific endonuclease VapC